MTKATPQAQNQQQPAQKAAGGEAQARSLSPEQRLQKILNPSAKQNGAAGEDNAADSNKNKKKKPPAQQKDTSTKPANQSKKPAKEAPKGHPEGEASLLDEATGEDDADLSEGDDLDQEDTQAEVDADGESDTDEGDILDDEADADEAEDDGTLYKVKVAGKEEEVTLSELLSGYSRTKDYLQKTQAVAKEKKEVEALRESVKDLPQQRETYVKGAERFGTAAVVMLQAMQQKFMPKQPDPELAKSDPAAYFAQKEACQEAMQFTGALQQELGNIQEKIQKDARETHAKAVQESRKKLYEAMPEMAQAPARQKLREYANSLGFTDDQIAQEANHVLFLCVEKARRWDELQAQKANVKPKAPVQKVAHRTNAAETKRAINQRDKNTVLSEHKQKGTIKSAEKALERIFSA